MPQEPVSRRESDGREKWVAISSRTTICTYPAACWTSAKRSLRPRATWRCTRRRQKNSAVAVCLVSPSRNSRKKSKLTTRWAHRTTIQSRRRWPVSIQHLPALRPKFHYYCGDSYFFIIRCFACITGNWLYLKILNRVLDYDKCRKASSNEFSCAWDLPVS